jgi:hypothetical protein
MESDKATIKFQIFANLCMGNLEFSSPQDILEATKVMYNFITEGVDVDGGDKPTATLHTVQ